MRKTAASQSGIFDSRVLIGFAFCLVGVFLALLGLGLYPGASARAQGPKQNQMDVGAPQVVPMVGPVSQDQDLRALPYIPSSTQFEERRLTRYPPSQIPSQGKTDPVRAVRQSAQAAAMPTPIATFAGINSGTSGCNCLPPDTHGDVGPNHYIQSVNSSIQIFNKTGGTLSGPTTYNTFFAALNTSGTPCGLNQNDGDGFVFYDQLADRWVVSDFAFAGGLPGPGPFYQCIGVSKTGDPVAGGWWLYALQVDPSNPTWVGDYPKLALWPDAYYLSVNMFDGPMLGFQGVRVYALPRGAMINGTGAPNPGAVAFTVLPAGLGDAYSLVPATFRAGSAPPVGTPEYFMAVDSPATAGVVLTAVKAWKFHVDFGMAGNSTFGLGANHTPDGIVTVNGFVDAFISGGVTLLVPQNGTTAKLDTLGDKLMTPLVYQNLGGTESLWASQTVNNNQNGTGPTAIRWYQFNVTGNTIPATPVQQQTFNNGADGLWRWMPSIAVDAQGNMAIGYSVSSATSEPSIRYAGRLAADSPNSLAQGEALLIAGAGHQTHSAGRWGDYSGMSIDPSDNLTFWHTNEYFSATSSASWNTRIGKFQFPSLPQLVTAVSRKMHGALGPFDIDLKPPAPAIEMRRNTGADTTGPNVGHDHELIITFGVPVTVGGCTASGGATCTATASGSTVTADLHNVADVQALTITLTNVNGAGSVSVLMNVLAGDTNEDKRTNVGDTDQTKSLASATLDQSSGTFKADVNLDGRINVGDTNFVKAHSGSSLP